MGNQVAVNTITDVENLEDLERIALAQRELMREVANTMADMQANYVHVQTVIAARISENHEMETSPVNRLALRADEAPPGLWIDLTKANLEDSDVEEISSGGPFGPKRSRSESSTATASSCENRLPPPPPPPSRGQARGGKPPGVWVASKGAGKTDEDDSGCGKPNGCGKPYGCGKPDGCGKPGLPEPPKNRVPAELAVRRHSTVFVQGFNDRVAENVYVEWFNSIGGRYDPLGNALSAVNIGMWFDANQQEYRYRGSGYFLYANERLARLAVENLHRTSPHRDAKSLYVQMSDRPISLRANQRHRVAGQPRTGNRIFETAHPGYPAGPRPANR